MITTVLFDLDGTLSDSAPGILAALRHAFAVTGVAPLPPARERELLGPPFSVSLPPIVGQHRLDAVIAAYREQYGAGGMFDTTRYDGVLDVVRELRRRGITLAVATSKPEPYATRIVEHLGLGEAFVTVCGDTLDGQRDSKALVVAEALRRLGGPPAGTVLMVGDRVHDVVGAGAHGVATLGAGWGYGTTGELSGAHAVFGTPRELCVALPGLVGASWPGQRTG